MQEVGRGQEIDVLSWLGLRSGVQEALTCLDSVALHQGSFPLSLPPYCWTLAEEGLSGDHGGHDSWAELQCPLTAPQLQSEGVEAPRKDSWARN